MEKNSALDWEKITQQAELTAFLEFKRKKLYVSMVDFLELIERAKNTFGEEKTLAILAKTLNDKKLELEPFSTLITRQFIKNIEEK